MYAVHCFLFGIHLLLQTVGLYQNNDAYGYWRHTAPFSHINLNNALVWLLSRLGQNNYPMGTHKWIMNSAGFYKLSLIWPNPNQNVTNLCHKPVVFNFM